MADLYTLGNFTIDDIVFYDGRTRMGQPGGNVLYSAAGARVWLDEVGIIARVGDDFPEDYSTVLTERNFRLFLHRVGLADIHNWALYEADGRRQFVLHESSGSLEAMSLRPDEIPSGCLGARAYHVASMPSVRQHELVKTLKRAGNIISLDPHEEYILGQEKMVEAILELVDCFLPSRKEAQLFYGRDDPESAVREFARFGSCIAAVKLGAEGSLVCDAAGSRVSHIPAYSTIVRDATGAGDGFCGGFLAGYLLQGNAVQAGCYGNVSASYVIEGLGSMSTQVPRRAAAEERLAVVGQKVIEVDY